MGFQCQGSFSPNNTRKSSRFGKVWNIYSSFRLNLEQRFKDFKAAHFSACWNFCVIVNLNSIEIFTWIFNLRRKRALDFSTEEAASFPAQEFNVLYLLFTRKPSQTKGKVSAKPNVILVFVSKCNKHSRQNSWLWHDLWRFFVTSWQMQIMIIINKQCVFFFTIQIHLLGFSRLITPLKKKGLIFPNKIACVLLKEALFQSCSSLNFTWGEPPLQKRFLTSYSHPPCTFVLLQQWEAMPGSRQWKSNIFWYFLTFCFCSALLDSFICRFA